MPNSRCLTATHRGAVAGFSNQMPDQMPDQMANRCYPQASLVGSSDQDARPDA